MDGRQYTLRLVGWLTASWTEQRASSEGMLGIGDVVEEDEVPIAEPGVGGELAGLDPGQVSAGEHEDEV